MAKAKRNIEPKEPAEKPVRKRAYNRKVKEPEQPIDIPEPIHEEQPKSKPYETFFKRHWIYIVTAGVFLIAIVWIAIWSNSRGKIKSDKAKYEQKATKDLKALDPEKERILNRRLLDSIHHLHDSIDEVESKKERIEAEINTVKQKANNKKKEDDTKSKIRNPNISSAELDRILDDLLRAREANKNH